MSARATCPNCRAENDCTFVPNTKAPVSTLSCPICSNEFAYRPSVTEVDLAQRIAGFIKVACPRCANTGPHAPHSAPNTLYCEPCGLVFAPVVVTHVERQHEAERADAFAKSSFPHHFIAGTHSRFKGPPAETCGTCGRDPRNSNHQAPYQCGIKDCSSSCFYGYTVCTTHLDKLAPKTGQRSPEDPGCPLYLADPINARSWTCKLHGIDGGSKCALSAAFQRGPEDPKFWTKESFEARSAPPITPPLRPYNDRELAGIADRDDYMSKYAILQLIKERDDSRADARELRRRLKTARDRLKSLGEDAKQASLHLSGATIHNREPLDE